VNKISYQEYCAPEKAAYALQKALIRRQCASQGSVKGDESAIKIVKNITLGNFVSWQLISAPSSLIPDP
jgi:hypothetical protein